MKNVKLELMTAAEMAEAAGSGPVWFGGREKNGPWQLAWMVTAKTNARGHIELTGPNFFTDTMRPTTRVYAAPKEPDA